MENQLSLGWIAVSAAGSHGQGSRKRSVCFTDTGNTGRFARDVVLAVLESNTAHVKFGCRQMGSILINGAATKVMNLDRLGKQVRPGTFGKTKVD